MYYKRATEDGQYWAVTNGKKVWTRSPSHLPASASVYRDPEIAKRSVDYYLDVIVPHMIEESEIPPKAVLIEVPIRTIMKTAAAA